MPLSRSMSAKCRTSCIIPSGVHHRICARARVRAEGPLRRGPSASARHWTRRCSWRAPGALWETAWHGRQDSANPVLAAARRGLNRISARHPWIHDEHFHGLDETLARPGLLVPGGRLLVIGLARVSSLPDLAAELTSAAVNPGHGPGQPRQAGPPGRRCRGRPAGHVGQRSRYDPGRYRPRPPAPISLAPPSCGACSSAAPRAGASRRCRRLAPVPAGQRAARSR